MVSVGHDDTKSQALAFAVMQKVSQEQKLLDANIKEITEKHADISFNTNYLCDAPGCDAAPCGGGTPAGQILNATATGQIMHHVFTCLQCNQRRYCSEDCAERDSDHVCVRSIIVQIAELIVRSRTTQDPIGDLDFTYHGPKPITMLPTPAPFPAPPPAMNHMPDPAPATQKLRPTLNMLQTIADTNDVLGKLRAAMAAHTGSKVVPHATLEFVTTGFPADDWQNQYHNSMDTSTS
jgi:hypothetical protein